MTAPISSTSSERTRFGAVALASAGLLFAAFPLVRPFFPNPSAGASAADLATVRDGLASTAWLVSHLMAGAGFILLLPGLFTVHELLASEQLDGRAARGLLLVFVGSAVLLIVLGGEAFGLSAVGRAYASGDATDLVAMVGRVRSPVLFVSLLSGLLLLAAGGIVLATAIRRSDMLPHWSGIVLAAGLGLWMPLLPQPARLVDGLLIGVGSWALAVALWRLSTRSAEVLAPRFS